MLFHDLRRLVRKGEGQTLEFKLKTTHPEKIVKEIVAFANSDGGTLLLGIRDDLTIKGLKFPQEDEYVMNKAIDQYCYPPINYKLEKIPVEGNREVLAYTIPASDKGPHRVVEGDKPNQGKVYVRVDHESIIAGKEMREILKGRRKKRDLRFQYGKKEEVLMKYLDLHQQITVQQFAETAEIPRRVASRTLVLLVLAKVLQIYPQASKEDSFGLLESDEQREAVSYLD
ncbi:transcriptional regulator [marine bacterium AO1-C]|nr:transcriptional regulator [marine bacterium AO1-C]